MESIVWVVTYYDKGDPEATVTVFNNIQAADTYRAYLINKHQHVSMDKCSIYSEFNRKV